MPDHEKFPVLTDAEGWQVVSQKLIDGKKEEDLGSAWCDRAKAVQHMPAAPVPQPAAPLPKRKAKKEESKEVEEDDILETDYDFRHRIGQNRAKARARFGRGAGRGNATRQSTEAEDEEEAGAWEEPAEMQTLAGIWVGPPREKTRVAVAVRQVVVELNWDVPADDVVLVAGRPAVRLWTEGYECHPWTLKLPEDLWMSSASLESQKFIKDFAPKRAVLNEYLQFVPHYHVFSMESSQDYKELCSDVTGRFCAEDPDVSGSVTGRDVLMEDVRQLCIHELTAITTDKRRKSSSMPIPLAVRQKLPFFSSQWWQYASILLDECPVDGKTSDRAFGPECSARVMRQVGIDVEKVEECVAETKDRSRFRNLHVESNGPSVSLQLPARFG
ncbi:unnamed protein product [Effrenium voratum]|nr:unnamed protein product [Effrenium voratum]